MLHALAFEPLGQIVCHVARPIVAEKPRPVRNGDVIKARCRERLVAWRLARYRQVFVILRLVWPLNLLFDRLTDFFAVLQD
jgi:hypothetical protein